MNQPLRTEIARRFTFEAAHFLPHVPADHKCARMHGHSFRAKVIVGGDIDPTLGWIVDFARLDEAWKPLHALLDHRLLNEVPGLENPTSEHIAAFIFERYHCPDAQLLAVEISETCTSSCTVYAPGHDR